MLSENTFRLQVEAAGQMRDFQVTHIESHLTSAGIPDLNMCKAGVDLWLELKVVKEGKIILRPTQRKWLRERTEAGGEAWVLVQLDAGCALLVPGFLAYSAGQKVEQWLRIQGGTVIAIADLGSKLEDLVLARYLTQRN